MKDVNFENIKIGDKVIINLSGVEDTAEVEKVTKTQFTVSSGFRFFKKNGIMVGDNCCYAREYSKEDAERISRLKDRRRMLAYINTVSFRLLSDEKLKRVYDILKAE